MTPPPELPLDFRPELVPHVFKAVTGGWSCAVVGLPGLGLSNLLRFMAEPRVAQYYLGAEAAQSLTVYIEADRLADTKMVFGRLAAEVVAAAHTHQWPRAEQAALRRLADLPKNTTGEPAAPLAGLIQHICGDLERRVIFVCDEFETALRAWPTGTLRELRALRDAHKYRLAFGVGLRRDARWVAATGADDERTSGAAKMAELFDQHTFPLRPYASADARLTIARKTVGWAKPPTEEQQDQLYRASGGHAKLLIASLIYLEPRLHLPWANVERGLLSDPGLAEIGSALWEALEPADRWALWKLAHEQRDTVPEAGLKRLELLGLVAGGPAFVFSSIFEAFVLKQPEPAAPDPAVPAPVSLLRDPAARINW